MAIDQNKHRPNADLSDAPCNGCPSEESCAEGRVCWDFVHFVQYNFIGVEDRRPSKQLYVNAITKPKPGRIITQVDDYENL